MSLDLSVNSEVWSQSATGDALRYVQKSWKVQKVGKKKSEKVQKSLNPKFEKVQKRNVQKSWEKLKQIWT